MQRVEACFRLTNTLVEEQVWVVAELVAPTRSSSAAQSGRFTCLYNAHPVFLRNFSGGHSIGTDLQPRFTLQIARDKTTFICSPSRATGKACCRLASP